MKKRIKYLVVLFSVVFLLTILIPAQLFADSPQPPVCAVKLQKDGVKLFSDLILHTRKFVSFDWVYQPDGTTNLSSGDLSRGSAILYAAVDRPICHSSCGFIFSTATVTDPVADVYFSDSSRYPCTFWANNGSGGIHDMGAVSLESVTQAPDASKGVGYFKFDFYDNQDTDVIIGHTYCIVTKDGAHYAKIYVTDIGTGEAPPENQPPVDDIEEDQSVIEKEAPPEEQPAPTQYTLTINISGQGTTNPVQGRSHIYSDGTQVTVKAIPASGWSFDQWRGNASGTNTSVTITMDSNKNITAYFTTEMPVLEDIYPKHGTPGELVTLVGKNFGYEKRIGSYVRFGLSMAEIVKWTNDKIVVRAPDDYGLGIDDAKFAFKFITLRLSAASDQTFEFGLKLLKAFVLDLELITKKISEDEPLPLQWVKIAAAIGAPAGLVALRPAGELDVPVTVKTSIGESEERIIFIFNCDGLPPIDIEDSLMVSLASPGELRIYDSQGRVTGLVNGEVKTEVPNSDYYNEQLIVFNAIDSYRYEVVGVDDGTYGLNVTRVSNRGIETFNATNVPTGIRVVHQYSIDWNVLSQGEEGVTLKIDSDGDGTFEKTFTEDSELTHDEFASKTAGLSFWIWIAGGVVIILILVIACILIKRRLARR